MARKEEFSISILTLGGTVITASGTEINKLDGVGAKIASGTVVAKQANLAVDANGTAIAAAVNGLRDALIAFGIMAAS